MTSNKPKILIILNIDYFLISHRLPIALKAIEKGYEVHLATQVTSYSEEIKKYGILIHPIRISRSGINFLEILKTCKDIFNTINLVKPKVLHLISIKPVLLGGLVCHLIKKKPSIISAISGLGTVFIDSGLKASFIKLISLILYKIAFAHRNLNCIVQNKDDYKFITDISNFKNKNIFLIPGSGVNLSKFVPTKNEPKIPVILFPSRLIKNKGIFEFIEAAKALKGKARFAISGALDFGSKDSITKSDLRSIVKNNFIEYWGFSTNMQATLSKSTIVVLPSYREGLPKVLCEAAACSKAIITTNVPGCREAIIHNKSGLLIPHKNVPALIKSIEMLLNNPKLTNKLGQKGRELAEEKFDVKKIVNSHLKIYKECIEDIKN